MATETANAPANELSMDVQVVDGMVPKVEFDRAIEAAQQALRAKTASSQQMLAQASSAMRNALTALSLSEQEVANLKATVKELQERPAEGTNEIIEREREELRPWIEPCCVLVFPLAFFWRSHIKTRSDALRKFHPIGGCRIRPPQNCLEGVLKE